MNIWIDTDIGGDIDDAFALLLAMSNSELKIKGVSTVFENTFLRAKIAKTILSMGGYESIPVYCGRGKPIIAKTVHRFNIDENSAPKTYIAEKFQDAKIESKDCIEALKDAIENEKDLEIICLGALTNIAELIKKYPETANKIKTLRIMGGAQKLNLNEFNFTCDPEAADIVLSSSINKKITTLDVTFLCDLNDKQVCSLLNCKSDAVTTVMDMCKLWNGKIILHDPLTLATAISDEFVTFQEGNMKVELNGAFSRGKCVDLCDFNWNYPPREDLKISVGVNKDEFLDYCVKSICSFDEKLTKK